MRSKKKTAAWGLHHTTVNPLHIATYAVVTKQYTKVGSNSIAYLPCLSKQRGKKKSILRSKKKSTTRRDTHGGPRKEVTK